MCIGREEEKIMLSYVGFFRLRNFIKLFPYLNIDLLINSITFPILYSEISFQWRENFLTGLEKYVKQIYTSRYGDYIITYHYFHHKSPLKRASNIRVICDHIHFTDRYHFNILRIIAIIYQLYIECELYILAYINKPVWLYEQ